MKPNASLNNDARKLADSSVYYLQLSAMLHSYEKIQYYSAAFGSSPLRKGRRKNQGNVDEKIPYQVTKATSSPTKGRSQTFITIHILEHKSIEIPELS